MVLRAFLGNVADEEVRSISEAARHFRFSDSRDVPTVDF